MKYVITQLEGELWGKICDFHLRLSWGLADWRTGDPLDALVDAEEGAQRIWGHPDLGGMPPS